MASGVEVLTHRAGMRADLHLAGISIGLAILQRAPDARALTAAHQAYLREIAAAFADPARGARFLALPWLAKVMSLSA